MIETEKRKATHNRATFQNQGFRVNQTILRVEYSRRGGPTTEFGVLLKVEQERIFIRPAELGQVGIDYIDMISVEEIPIGRILGLVNELIVHAKRLL